MTFKTTRYAYDFLAIGAIVFQRFLVMINAGFKWNDSSYFFCSLTSDFNHLVRFTRCIWEHRSQKLSPHSKHRIVASGAIPESYSSSTLHMSHISDVVSCLLNIFVTSKRSCMKKFFSIPLKPSSGMGNSFLHNGQGIFSPGFLS